MGALRGGWARGGARGAGARVGRKYNGLPWQRLLKDLNNDGGSKSVLGAFIFSRIQEFCLLSGDISTVDKPGHF